MMATDGGGAKKRTRSDQRKPSPAFIARLAAGATASDAGKVLGIPERTAQRWAALDDVAADVRAARAAMIDRAAGRLADLVDEASDTLRDIMRDGDAPASARVRAASLVLTLALELRDRTELENRLSALEALSGSAT